MPRTVAILLSILGLWAPAGPLSADVAFFPFGVSGRPDLRLLDTDRLPVDLAEATRFLFGLRKSYPARSERAVRRTLAARGLGRLYSGPLPADQARRACSALGAETLIFGRAAFEGPRTVRLVLRSFGCRSGQTLYRAERRADWNRLQPTLNALLEEVTPFAPGRFLPAGHGRPRSAGGVVVLDLSGSMRAALPDIRAGLAARLRAGGGEVFLVAVQAGRPPQVLGPYRGPTRLAAAFDRLRPAGEVRLSEVSAALSTAGRLPLRGPVLWVLTDAKADPRGLATLEAKLRYLQGNGFRPRLHEMPSASAGSRAALVRLAVSLGLPPATVAYGREARFVDADPILYVSQGGRFYRGRAGLRAAILANRIDTRRLEAVAGGGDLEALARRAARDAGLTMAGFGPPLSGLRQAIEADGRSVAASAPYRALVRNGGHAFWISLNGRAAFKSLGRVRGRRVYLGLRFRALRTGGMTNDPDFLTIRSQGSVPRLLVNTWGHLIALPPALIQPVNVWFLLCEVRELRSVPR